MENFDLFFKELTEIEISTYKEGENTYLDLHHYREGGNRGQSLLPSANSAISDLISLPNDTAIIRYLNRLKPLISKYIKFYNCFETIVSKMPEEQNIQYWKFEDEINNYFLTNKIPNDIVYISHVLLSDLYDAVLYKDNALQYLLDEVYRITDIENNIRTINDNEKRINGFVHKEIKISKSEFIYNNIIINDTEKRAPLPIPKEVQENNSEFKYNPKLINKNQEPLDLSNPITIEDIENRIKQEQHSNIFCNNGFELFEYLMKEFVAPKGKRGRQSDVLFCYWKLHEIRPQLIHQRPQTFLEWFNKEYEPDENVIQNRTFNQVKSDSREGLFNYSLDKFKLKT